MVTKIREFNMIIAGVGGQGSVLASHIVADAALSSGFKTRVGETFGASQRGGKVHSHVRFGEDVYCPLCPEESLNVLIGLEPNETLRLALSYTNNDTYVITNTHPIPSMDVNIGAVTYPPIDEIILGLKKLSQIVVAFDATQLAVQAGNLQTVNIVMLGALAASRRLPFEADILCSTIMERVPLKTRDVNLKAFNFGQNVIQG